MTTLAELLVDRPATAAERVERQLSRQSGELRLATHGVPNLSRRAANAISEMLETPVGELILRAWEKQQAVEEACRRTTAKGATTTVAVLEHSLRSSQRPAAYLDIAGRRVRVLELVLSLTLNIEALTLTITDRRVTGFGPTTASSTAELAVELPMGGTHTLLKQELGRVVLLPYRVHNAVHASPGATSPAIP